LCVTHLFFNQYASICRFGGIRYSWMAKHTSVKNRALKSPLRRAFFGLLHCVRNDGLGELFRLLHCIRNDGLGELFGLLHCIRNDEA
jgi:hypothetical protein